MPFGARNEEGWRLCHRKGRTCRHVNKKAWPDIEIKFSSQAKAKACADELNEKFWPTKGGKPDYVLMDTEKMDWDPDLMMDMLNIIGKHGGITGDQFDEIEVYLFGDEA